jgi:hypothetical protein
MAIRSEFLSPERRTFEQTVRQSDDITAAAVIEIVVAIQESALSLAERVRRIQDIISLGRLCPADLVELGKKLSKEGRVAAQAILPPEHQRLLYAQKENSTPAILPPLQIEPPPSSDASKSELEVLRDEANTVVLLGVGEAQDANTQFLLSNNFTPVSVRTVADLQIVLQGRICAVVVDRSWWKSLAEYAHKDELVRLLTFNTLAWLKIDTTELPPAVAASLLNLCKEHLFREPTISEISHGASCRIAPSDLEALRGAASRLSASTEIRLHPDEITETEAILLLGAIRAQHVAESIYEPVRIEKVKSSVIQGGRSQAKVILLRSEYHGHPFVVKLDEVNRIREELRRFNGFLRGWSQHIRPLFYAVKDRAAIFFSMIDGGAVSNVPAPTLYAKLADLASGERGFVMNPPAASDLKDLITRAATKLSELNRQRPPQLPHVADHCWLETEPFDELRTRGVIYRIDDNDEEVELNSLLVQAKSTANRLKGKAIVHGDIHLRNILVRHDREPAFIDFANSGPGHPAYDLVRLECSVLFSSFRMLDSEASLANLFFAVLAPNAQMAALEREHPRLLTSQNCLVAIHTALEVKRIATEVLGTFGGTLEDYLSIKLIVSCQALALPDPQSGIVRATIRATARALRAIQADRLQPRG